MMVESRWVGDEITAPRGAFHGEQQTTGDAVLKVPPVFPKKLISAICIELAVTAFLTPVKTIRYEL